MTTLHEFLVEALYPHPHLRMGQRFMSVLYEKNRVVYNILNEQYPKLNAFYFDADLWATVHIVVKEWREHEKEGEAKSGNEVF